MQQRSRGDDRMGLLGREEVVACCGTMGPSLSMADKKGRDKMRMQMPECDMDVNLRSYLSKCIDLLKVRKLAWVQTGRKVVDISQ